MVSGIGKALKRIREKVAFTLSEALVAMIIMLLVTSVVAAGIPSAVRAYNNVVVASNAEVLLSTAMTALRNELGTAEDITVSGNEIEYYSQSTDRRSKIYLGSDDDDGYIMFKPDSKDDTTAKRLVSEQASDKGRNLKATYESVTYKDGIVTFTGLKVKKGDDTSTEVKNADGSSGGEYSIRVITDKQN